MIDKNNIKDLLDIVDQAIESGDWKVDGACDPSLLLSRMKWAVRRGEDKNMILKTIRATITQYGQGAFNNGIEVEIYNDLERIGFKIIKKRIGG